MKSLACLLHPCYISSNSLQHLFVAENVGEKFGQIFLFHATMPLKMCLNKGKTITHIENRPKVLNIPILMKSRYLLKILEQVYLKEKQKAVRKGIIPYS